MAHLSKELGCVLLDRKHFGAHLDDKGNTVGPQIELKSFEHNRKILGEIWSRMVINDYQVIAEYIVDKALKIVKDVSEIWRSSHVRSSQYLLQIIKCNNITCCTSFRSSNKKIVKDSFLHFLHLPCLKVSIMGSHGQDLIKRVSIYCCIKQLP